MAKPGLLKLAGLVLIVVLAAAAYLLLWPVITQKAEHRLAAIGLTLNEVAANGPLPGDVSLYLKELACAEKLPRPGYYRAIDRKSTRLNSSHGYISYAAF